MTDTLRMLIMQVVANLFAVITALGLVDISAENFGLITVLINSTLLLAAYFIKSGQGTSASKPSAQVCCRLEVEPLVLDIVAAQLAIGQFEFQPHNNTWRREIPEEHTCVQASFVDKRLHLEIYPAIQHYDHHAGKRITAGVYFEIAARYAQKVNGRIEQLANVVGCSTTGIQRKLLAEYPNSPMNFNAICNGFMEVLNQADNSGPATQYGFRYLGRLSGF